MADLQEVLRLLHKYEIKKRPNLDNARVWGVHIRLYADESCTLVTEWLENSGSPLNDLLTESTETEETFDSLCELMQALQEKCNESK